MESNPCRIVIIEPSEIIVSGIQKIIDTAPDLTLVGVFQDTHQALERLTNLRADLVIVNPTLLEFSKRASLRGIFADVNIIALLYNYIDKETLDQFHGVIGIYDKPSKIVYTLRQATLESPDDSSVSNAEELSSREKDILIAVAKGLLNKEIASLHNISIHTVISHRKNISRKTGIKSVSGFVVYALLNNLLEEHEIR